VAYVRTVKTASGATAVQIVHSTRRGARDIEHLGSAHDEAELTAPTGTYRQTTQATPGQTQILAKLNLAPPPLILSLDTTPEA